jgi:transmembrane sensor
MKNYENYSVEDFIQDEAFRDWIQGRAQHETFWLSFLQNYPEKTETFRQAERFVRATAIAGEQLSEREIRTEVQRFLERATDSRTADNPSASAAEPSTQVPFRQISRYPAFKYLVAMVAILAVAMGLGWHLHRVQTDPQAVSATDSPASQLVSTNNPTNKPLRVLLSDSSEVVLSPNSRLRYPSQFTDTARVVYLTGEAVFSVNHQKRAFIVVSGEMITKVLGTRFVVSAYDKNPKMSVQVLSGKVSVYRSEPNRTVGSKEVKGLILTANQAAIFEKELLHLSKTLVANPIVLTKKTLQLETRYDEVPLSDILHELETSYGITIQFDEQNFRPCRITATLSNETLYEKLDLLCKTVSASYEIVDGQIVVSGDGCR